MKQCARVLGVSSQGYYKYRLRPLAPTKMRREWLTGIIRDVHVASRGTYGYRRVHAELTQAHGVFVSANLVNLLMHNAAITGLPGPGKASRNAGVPTDDDLVNRRFNRDGLNELWVSDITEHKTPWIPRIVATLAYLFSWSRAYRRSVGVSQLSAFRGRSLSSLATC